MDLLDPSPEHARIESTLALLPPTPRKQRTPEERLLRRASAARRGWRGHLHSYLAVNSGLVAINLLTAIGAGSLAALFPWSLIAAAGWGIGLGVHGLNHRAWLADNRVAVDRALTRVDAWQTTGPALPAPDPAAQVDLSPPSPAAAAPPTTPRSSAPGIDPEWKALIARGEDAVRRARAALGEHAGGDPRGVHARLGGGLSDVEGLAMSATRLRLALDHVGSGGGDELASRIAELDRRVAGADDPRLARVYESNRGLLVARRTKIRTIEAELERVRASAEGFVLAAENLQLDAARLGAGHLGDVGDALFEPLERLGEEVEILRQVEVELEAL